MHGNLNFKMQYIRDTSSSPGLESRSKSSTTLTWLVLCHGLLRTTGSFLVVVVISEVFSAVA
jgi:hypothetical protein